MLYSFAMSVALSPASNNVIMRRLVVASSVGLPPIRPRLRAACKPARVRSRMMLRLNSANTASIPNITFPADVVVSILSLILTNSTSLLSRLSVISNNWRVDRASLSSL